MYGMPRVSKENIEGTISDILGIYDATFTKLDEEPRIWKHSCKATGVTVLTHNQFNFYGIAIIEYVYCRECNHVMYCVLDY